MSMEIQFLNAIQMTRTPLLDFLMPLISNGVVLWLFFPIVLIIRRDTRRAGIIVLAAIFLEMILCNLVMKNLFQRVRPCDVNTSIALLTKRPTDYSFPSGHTSLSFAAASGLWFSGVLRRWRIPALVLACLISYSRLYLYLHYPTDVLAGVAVGVFCGWMACQMIQRHSFRQNRKQETTV
jgi:membrane-associated phospholipid phosphatase